MIKEVFKPYKDLWDNFVPVFEPLKEVFYILIEFIWIVICLPFFILNLIMGDENN